ncbi:MAG: SUMF1/EgtB/PvdO family nonheme iron enzyme [Myxococcaceae bacterium]|nr:SUMF1/EgtB/PvdO family nonheme iron enzyme [Myxococcaceae bacterium]
MRWLSLLLLVAGPALAQWPTIDTSTPKQGGGEKDAALLISIEDYMVLPDIGGATQNASDWYLHLTKTRGVPAANVLWLKDNEATLEGIKVAAEKVVQLVKPGGVLWVLYVGHGAPSDTGEDGVLVGADAQQTTLQLYARSLPRSALLETLQRGKQARTFVFLDACFSGQASTGQLATGMMPTLPEKERSLSSKSVVLLTAGTSRQFAGPLQGEARPAFSYLALGGLRGWADDDGDGSITAGELASFSNAVLRSTVNGRVQTPTLNPESASAVVVGKVSGGRQSFPLSDIVVWLKGAAGGTKANLEPAPEVKATGPKVTSGGVKAVVGSLTVKTTPAGARLDLVDPKGQALATRAPLVKPDAVPGRWKVTATLDGYATQTREVDVPPDDVAFVEVTFQKPASLEVVGTPEGALVRVTGPEGFSKEGGLPWKAEGLTPGEYTVSISRDGYTGEGWTGMVAAGQAQRVTTKLKRADVKEAGGTRVDPRTGITWVWMPPGTFAQGCVPGDGECDQDEKPARTQTVTGFWMAKTETTVKQFEQCAQAGVCAANLREQDTAQKTCNWKNGRAAHPMNCLNWEEAGAYCRWAGGRLPTATEWEYAAKSGRPTIFPWGDARPDGRLANFCDRKCPEALANPKKWEENGWVSRQVDDGYAGTAPVGSYSAGVSGWGLLDMAGNVWEWTASDYDAKTKELRGGGWGYTPISLRSSYRDRVAPSLRDDNGGFRCAQ